MDKMILVECTLQECIKSDSDYSACILLHNRDCTIIGMGTHG